MTSIPITISTIVQVSGALLILAPFTLAQFRLLGQHSWRYLVPNMIGSGILCALALLDAQWGFVLLEGVWALVSLSGLIALARACHARQRRQRRQRRHT